MSLLQIPVFVNEASNTQLLSLDGIIYRVRIYWNVRDNAWHFDLFLADDTPVLCGIKMVVNFTLISQVIGANIPLGDFLLLDASGNNNPCGRDELGGRCTFIYITSDDEILAE